MGLLIREYEDTDEEGVIELLAVSLGKSVDDRYRDLYRWKHLRNPFGRSFMWVAEVDGHLAGFRALLRWRFVDPSGDVVLAVRAVDTATHPDHRGSGVFRALTLHALDEVRVAGADFVFNTPNDQSRPGYLKMGWTVDGRVPVKVRPRSVMTLWNIARARVAADPWSLPVDLGVPVPEVGSDVLGAPARPRPGSLVTDRSEAFVRWRYAGCAAVSSVAVPAGEGVALVRFRRRGPSVECTVGDVLGTEDRQAALRAVRRAMREGRADFAIASSSAPVGGMVQVDRLGPIQTRRVLDDRPSLPLSLSLGDTELF